VAVEVSLSSLYPLNGRSLQIPSQGLCHAAFALMGKDGRVTARDLQMVLADLRGPDVFVLQLLLP
jgi:hypothetical protein